MVISSSGKRRGINVDYNIPRRGVLTKTSSTAPSPGGGKNRHTTSTTSAEITIMTRRFAADSVYDSSSSTSSLSFAVVPASLPCRRVVGPHSASTRSSNSTIHKENNNKNKKKKITTRTLLLFSCSFLSMTMIIPAVIVIYSLSTLSSLSRVVVVNDDSSSIIDTDHTMQQLGRTFLMLDTTTTTTSNSSSTIAPATSVGDGEMGLPDTFNALSVVQRQQQKTTTTTTSTRRCIAIGIFSRAKEFSLRKWHRDKFYKYGNTHRFSDNVTIELIFGVAEPVDEETLEGIRQEQLENKANTRNSHSTTIYDDGKDDMVIFDFKETEECMHRNRCLTRNAHALFRNMRDSLCGADNEDVDESQYEATYFVKMDDDVVLNYELLARVFMEFPTESVHFGRMLPNVPSVGEEERNLVNFAHSFFPVWPQGAFRGFSKDILDLTLLPQNIATILRPEHSYFFRDSDRAAGALIERAQIAVNHTIFTKGYYFICSIEDITCESYWNTIAFHIGFGLSGDDGDKIGRKLDTMNQVFDSVLQQCDVSYDSFNASDHFFIIDDAFQQSSATEWMYHGCSTVDDTAINMTETYERLHFHEKQLELLGINNETCAEQTYWQAAGSINKTATETTTTTIPSTVFDSSDIEESSISEFARAFLDKMSTDPTQMNLSAKSHFLSWGYRSDLFQYYCPFFKHICEYNCEQCDKEQAYFELYPDVKTAVEVGNFTSGLAHYELHGVEDGHIYPCLTDNEQGQKVQSLRESDDCWNTVSTFINQTSHLIANWPITGNVDYSLDAPQCNAAVLVEWREHPWMDQVLKIHRRYLGPFWMFYLVGPKSSTQLWRQKYNGTMITIIDLPDEFEDSSNQRDNFNQVLMSKFLWEDTVQCENVLITGIYSILLRHGVEDFFRYDYVGSPIYPDTLTGHDHGKTLWTIMAAYQNKWGGKGDLSIRKRSIMLKAIKTCPLSTKEYPEEVWISACIMLMDGKLPFPTIANRFSIGSKCEVDVPFGVNKMWDKCRQNACLKAILTSRLHRDLFGEANTDRNCPEGESLYLYMYDFVRREIDRNHVVSGWDHYNKFGKSQGFLWRCIGHDNVIPDSII